MILNYLNTQLLFFFTGLRVMLTRGIHFFLTVFVAFLLHGKGCTNLAFFWTVLTSCFLIRSVLIFNFSFTICRKTEKWRNYMVINMCQSICVHFYKHPPQKIIKFKLLVNSFTDHKWLEMVCLIHLMYTSQLGHEEKNFLNLIFILLLHATQIRVRFFFPIK